MDAHAKQRTKETGAVQATSVKKPSRSSAQAVDRDTDFAKLVTNHIESATVEMKFAFDDSNPYVPIEGHDEWQRRRSASAPPIPIPRPVPSSSHRSDLGLVSARSASPARALGFSAHFGMTAISGAPAAALTESVSASASTSNPTSEGSSRMSSFSEHKGGFRHGLSSELACVEAITSPRRHHRSSPANVEPMVAERLDVSDPCLVEGAISTLKRMTMSGGERAIF
jgi:hypothetical protein